MKNPFPKQVPPSFFWCGCNPDQCAYAAHAVNQHEKLVAMLKKHEWVIWHGQEWCDECDQPRIGGHLVDCELAALLAEVKP